MLFPCFFLSLFGLSLGSTSSTTTTTLPNSCKGLTDGYHLLKLMENGPIIYTQCSNNYMIIDPSVDSTISNYFSSWVGWHYGINGPSKSDHINWEQWYLPNDHQTVYFPTETCDTCYLLDDGETQINTAYYMNANLFGCIGFGRGIVSCDWDFWTYECRACKRAEFADHKDRTFTHVDIDSEEAILGECGVLVVETNSANIAQTYKECSTTFGSYKPSIGNNGKFCVCTQPSITKNYQVSSNEIEEKMNSINSIDTSTTISTSAQFQSLIRQIEVINENRQQFVSQIQSTTEENGQNGLPVTHLYQEDFLKGTYRILKSGIYIIEEDITFDFKSNYEDPNSDGAWFPVESEQREYPGAGQSRDGYYLGFFAGITIETDNVILDLNGHVLQQSLAFSIQQGFFTLIECGSQPFLPGQGIGFFGANPQLPSDITIMNGELGLTSHHAIHGNYNKNVVIDNLKIYDFTTHGIQLNGFENVVISNIEIGPSTTKAYVTAGYSHARALLSVAKILAQDESTNQQKIPFYGRENQGTTMIDIAERLQTQMDMVFDYVVKNINYDDVKYNKNDPEILENWKEAKQVFLKEDGIPYGSGMYGIFLNYPGSSIQSYHLNHERSNYVTVENVYIHDLTHKTVEALGLKTGLRNIANVFNAPFEPTQLFGLSTKELPKDLKEANGLTYHGNALLDFYFGMFYITKNWDYLGLTSLGDNFDEWVFGENNVVLSDIVKEYRCNGDSMGHPNKGLFGLRLDGVNNATINNVTIEDLLELSDLGSDLCGEYNTSFQTQRLPYQTGYSGNMLQGVSIDYSSVIMNDISVQNVESKTGLSTGMSFWYGSKVSLGGTIDIGDVKAGADIAINQLTYDDLPNRAPEACAMRVPGLLIPGEETLEIIEITNIDTLSIQCVVGHIGCNGLDDETNVGKYKGCAYDLNTLVHSRFSSNNYIISFHNLSYFSIVSIITIMTIALIIGATIYKKFWNNENSYILLK